MTIEELPDIVYHGTISIHKSSLLNGIDISKGYKYVDFGQGFYTTSIKEQALNIAAGRTDRYKSKRHTDNAYPMILTYSVDKKILSEYKGIIFDNGSEKWKEFIYNNRVGIDYIISAYNNLKRKYHYVYGYVADSDIIEMVRSARSSALSFGEFADRIKPHKKGMYDQLSFHTDIVLRALKFIECREVFDYE